jgi:hypothetical protein
MDPSFFKRRVPPERPEMNHPGCLSVSELEAYATQSAERARVSEIEAHLASCTACRTELALYSEFVQGAVRPDEEAAAGWIAARLTAPTADVFGKHVELEPSVPWWKSLFQFKLPALPTASLALASILVLVSVGLYVHSRWEPALDGGTSGTTEWRSNQISLLSPVGDVAQRPMELRWAAISHAVRYRVQMMEVDRTVLWSGITDQSRVALDPEAVRKIDTGKTILWQVTALDSSDQLLATSTIQSFRVTSHP